ncbi:glycosyltransferase family 2 protein [Paradonghicola geojensis]|nr:glycosyltransferase family 2 protein [Marivivens geojensis]
MTKLAAVIVTHNRADKLAKVLQALRSQTRVPDAIYVINNASTDYTGEVAVGVEYLRLPENIGGAGGFNLGMKRAYADGADLVWVSDDDAYPEPMAIAQLEQALDRFETDTGRQAPFACSWVKWTDGGHCEMNTPAPVWDWPRFYSSDAPVFLVSACSFVSCLIPRWAIEAHGFPIAEYFIWYDDAEYTQRLGQSHPGLFVPDSVVVHDLPVNQGVNYGLITGQSLWKFRYGARNETSARLRMMGWAGVAEFWLRAHRQMRGTPWRFRRAIYAAFWRGLWFRPEIERVE